MAGRHSAGYRTLILAGIAAPVVLSVYVALTPASLPELPLPAPPIDDRAPAAMLDPANDRAGDQAPATDWTLPAAARAGAAPAAGADLSGLRDRLLEQANYWAGKGQQEAAIAGYARVLQVAPDDPAALAGTARMQIDSGKNALADHTIARLRAVAPDDPALATLMWHRTMTEETKGLLADARQLAATKHLDDAVKTYKKAFGGELVPDDMAGEYYPVLIASLPADSVDANDALTALGAVAARQPGDIQLQFAYARTMTALEGTRADGVEKLRALAKNASVATQARAAWRDAILWQGADFTAQDELETYLKENPSDPELEAKRREFKESLPSEGVRARMRAYEAMRVKQMDVAEKEFRAALDFDADDVDAMIMIAAIRIQAKQPGEAQPLIDKAIALAPDRRAELLGMVGLDPAANARFAAEGAGAVTRQYDAVNQLAKRGAYDKAAEKLRALIGPSPNAGNELQLADLQGRAGQLDAAAASIEAALRLQPANEDAWQALAAVRTRQGRAAEAAAAFARLEALYAQTNNRAGLAALRRGRTEPLRKQAEAAADPARKLGLLRAAFAIDATDPWLRLDLARALQQTGGGAEAQTLMAAVVPPGAGAAESQAALQAGFVWAQERGNLAAAASLAERLPAAARTPPMQTAQSRVALAAAIRQASTPADPAGSRARLVALARQPDPTGQRGADLARASLRLHDREGVEAIIDAALQATPAPGALQRLAYAGVLAQAERSAAAHAMLDHVDRGKLPPELRPLYSATANGLIAQDADALIGKGKLAEAHALLLQHMADAPADPRLTLSLSRWQMASGQAAEALKLSDSVVQHHPDDAAARHVAIDAAIRAHDVARARDLLRDSLGRFADDPYFLMQAAQLAAVNDDKPDAINLLRQARTLRAQQLVSPGSDP